MKEYQSTSDTDNLKNRLVIKMSDMYYLMTLLIQS